MTSITKANYILKELSNLCSFLTEQEHIIKIQNIHSILSADIRKKRINNQKNQENVKDRFIKRREINRSYYDRNREELKQKRRERYNRNKEIQAMAQEDFK